VSGGSPTQETPPVTGGPDTETAEGIRRLLVRLTADLVAHLSRSTGPSPGEEDPPP